MPEKRRLHARTPESAAMARRVETALRLTSRLNLLPFDDLVSRREILDELFAGSAPESLTLYPPFYCDHGLNTVFGDRVFVNQGCSFFDLGGIELGDRVMLGPQVTLATAGHPVPLGERYDGVTLAPIVIEAEAWIGARATIAPGVRIGRGSVIGAGAVIAKDVPPLSVVTAGGQVLRKRIDG